MSKGIGYLSPQGVNYLLALEGWTGIKGGNYKQSATAIQQSFDRPGVITVGPGLTNLINGTIKSDITKGKTYQFEQISVYFGRFINYLCGRIDKTCPQIKDMGQGVVDMVISLSYNAGESWISKMKDVKTANDVYRKIGGGPVTANGKVLNALVSRRAAEAAICLGKDNGSNDCKRYFGEISQKAIDVIEAAGGDATDLVAGDTLTPSGSSSNVTVDSPNQPRPIMASRGANSVYKLSNASNKNNKNVADKRKGNFENKVNKFSSGAPELGRDIIISSEMYGSEILKEGQSSKIYSK